MSISPDGRRTSVRRKTRTVPQNRKVSAKSRQKYNTLALYLWTALAFPELVLHFSTPKSRDMMMNSGLLLGPLFALLPALLVFVLCISMPKRANHAVTLVYSTLSYLLCASQLVYYRIFGTFYTFFSMTNGAGAFQFGATIAAAIQSNFLTLLLMAVPLLVLIIGGRRLFRFRRRKHFAPKAVLVILGLVIQLVTVFALPMLGGTDDTTAYGLYHNASDAYLGVNKLGLFTAFRLDMTRTLTGNTADGSIVLEDPTVPETTLPPETTEPPLTAPPETTVPT
jgi:hypothetical protein